MVKYLLYPYYHRDDREDYVFSYDEPFGVFENLTEGLHTLFKVFEYYHFDLIELDIVLFDEESKDFLLVDNNWKLEEFKEFKRALDFWAAGMVNKLEFKQPNLPTKSVTLEATLTKEQTAVLFSLLGEVED